MMKQIFALGLMLVALFSYSQNGYVGEPDYDRIEKDIKKKKSNLFYDSLMDRYLSADSTMSTEEKRHLYYGYSFHKNYEPYAHSEYHDNLKEVFQKEELGNTELKQIVKFTDLILLEAPFDLNAINYQLYALEQQGEEQIFEKRVTQMRIIVDALLSSGNGMSKEEAFYVLYTSHEYDILNILGYQFGGSQSLIDHYDYLTVEKNETEIEGLYFDVTPCLNSLSKMFK